MTEKNRQVKLSGVCPVQKGLATRRGTALSMTRHRPGCSLVEEPVVTRPGFPLFSMASPAPTGWKTKLFGDNRFNFYGWIAAGLILTGFSVWLVLQAIRLGVNRSPTAMMLLAVYLILLGHFWLALQNYCARLGKAIETDDQQSEEPGGD